MSGKGPNIVVIMADQQRTDSLGCYGNVFVQSPHIDALAEGGVRFDDGFTPFPLCTPARAALWTGRLPSAHGLMDCIYGIEDAFATSPYPQTVFDQLAAGGYQNAYFGKWHLGSKRPDSMAHWHAFNSAGGHWLNGVQDFQGGQYLPELQTKRMCEYLRSQADQQQPFCVVQSYYPPHEPYTAPKRHVDLYRGKGIFRPGYYGAVTAVDECVGQIVATLEQLALRENTVIVYTSDHGEHFNYRANNNKTTGHDESIRIPMIVSWPGTLPGGRTVRGAAGLEDVAPTLLDIAGMAPPTDLHGKSLVALAEGVEHEGPDTYYIQNVEDFRSYAQWEKYMAGVYPADSRSHFSPDKEWDRQRALWTRTHKLVLSEHGDHLLYDLALDPEEELNIFGAPKEDIFNQYGRLPDQANLTLSLVENIESAAARAGDQWGSTLAKNVMEALTTRPIGS